MQFSRKIAPLMKAYGLGLATLAALGLAAAQPAQAQSVLIVGSDNSYLAGAQSALFATGQFAQVNIFNAAGGTPTLADLAKYSAVLAYTNNPPADPTGLGNVLADYVDGGGGVVEATYGMSSPYGIGGRISATGYDPLTDVGVKGNVSGKLSEVVPTDPIFKGINSSTFTYFHNVNFAHPKLDTGATVLATDGAGNDLIARNAAGSVLGYNLFPGYIGANQSNPQFYHLLANGLTSAADRNLPAAPEPSSVAAFAFTGLGAAGLILKARRRRTGV